MTKKKTAARGGIETRFSKVHAYAQATKKRVRVIPIPYWDMPDEPCVFYAYQLTVQEIALLDAREAASQLERNVYQIIHQCLDKDGKQYFSIADKGHIMNTPADVIGELMIALNGELSSFDKELKKNKD